VSYLVDTNAWIGFFEGSSWFGLRAKRVMVGEPGSCYISVASVWEAAIKIGLGKLRLPYDLGDDLPRLVEENGFKWLGIDVADAVGVRDLDRHHGDPFDRIMSMQARRRGLRIVSRDAVFESYGLKRVW
jgi:PIN domain nuclease of toxin-antitoxin system